MLKGYGKFELFSVPLANGDITKLNPPLVNGGDVMSYQISPDSNHVVYAADQETGGVPELFVTFEETPSPPPPPPPPGASYYSYIPFVHK